VAHAVNTHLYLIGIQRCYTVDRLFDVRFLVSFDVNVSFHVLFDNHGFDLKRLQHFEALLAENKLTSFDF
jgi:hypothetical protein